MTEVEYGVLRRTCADESQRKRDLFECRLRAAYCVVVSIRRPEGTFWRPRLEQAPKPPCKNSNCTAMNEVI